MISKCNERVTWTNKTKEHRVNSWTRLRREVAKADRARMVSVGSASVMLTPRRMGVEGKTRGDSIFHPLATGEEGLEDNCDKAEWRRAAATRGPRRRL